MKWNGKERKISRLKGGQSKLSGRLWDGGAVGGLRRTPSPTPPHRVTKGLCVNADSAPPHPHPLRRYYDGTLFHRSIRNFMIQVGGRLMGGGGG